MKEINENMVEWIFLLATTLLLPCVLTLLISGTEKKEEAFKSGIILKYENGQPVDMEEFLPYVIAAEIDLSYEEEVLKAQAVIARTNLMRELAGKKEAEIKDLSMAYLTPEKFENSLGTKAQEKILYRLKKAVKSTSGETIIYENNYIEALYHGVSIGTTVSSEEIFGKPRPYLIAVTSSQDVESEEYMTVKEWSAKEVLNLVNNKNVGKNMTVDTILGGLKIGEKTLNGYVKQVHIGDEEMSGEEWKQLFGINSTNFYLEEFDGKLRIITLGKGHGIGLSQYGANCMAKEKCGYKTILKKYYPGTEIKENFSNKV